MVFGEADQSAFIKNPPSEFAKTAKKLQTYNAAVADPGFPPRWGRQLSGGGAPKYDFAKISQKLHEIERIWTPGGARVQNFTI